ncbi:hypothetical protein MN086_08245 [Sulfurovum sp. XGS-02]|uniref:hypothetical protein n=1 Tax=Sulfurovum sp. XGS-02 TaxID=2925411 RepID=UPI00204EE9AD|nr:hypothetical protein [Sulfurovum sp. XGS-02]UPT77037.1 hypothetical protein MN086_08245 [Sulfurovum sp. XGS-02]
MTKIFMMLGVSSVLMITSISADDLKNSLTDMLNTKETSGVVDLGSINLDAKPKQPKTRSSKAVIATVNGHKIIKKEADSYLEQRTQGKVTNFDHLPPEQRPRLIQELVLPIIVLDAAQKELTEKEKQSVYTRAWMQKEGRKINVTDEEALTVYNQLKQQAEENNATQNIPSFETIKDKLKIQIIEKTLVDKLVKDAKIEVL